MLKIIFITRVVHYRLFFEHCDFILALLRVVYLNLNKISSKLFYFDSQVFEVLNKLMLNFKKKIIDFILKKLDQFS